MGFLRSALLLIIFSGLGGLVASHAYADDDTFHLNDLDPATSSVVRNGNQLTVTTKNAAGAVQANIYSLELIPKGTLFFHWTSEGTPERWMAQGGKIQPGELDWLSSPNTGTQVYGPGWYVSRNPTDSMSYGAEAIVETTQEDLWVINEPSKFGVFNPSSAAAAIQDRSLLSAQNVVGLKLSDTWFTLLDTRASSSFQPFNIKLALVALSKLSLTQEEATKAIFDLSSRVELIPDPYLEKYAPALNHLLGGGAIDSSQVSLLAKNYFTNLTSPTATQRKIFSHLSPAEKIQLLLTIAPPNSKKSLLNLVLVEQNIGDLPSDMLMRKAYPKFAPLFSNKSLNAKDSSSLVSMIREGGLLGYYGVTVTRNAPLTMRIQRNFPTELKSSFRGYYHNLKSGESAVREVILNNARSWGVPLSAFDAKAVDPGVLLNKGPPAMSFTEARSKLSQKGKDILDSLAVDEGGDLFRHLADPSFAPNAEQLQLWRGAFASKKEGEDLYTKLSGKTPEYRDSSIVIGGDITVPGTDKKYLQVSKLQLETLENNPNLVVESLPDPAHKGFFLVRYELPSAGNFHHFENNLEDTFLVNDLRAAEAAGQLKDPSCDTFKALTQRLVKALTINKYYEDTYKSPLDKYVKAVSIHLFAEDSDLFARLVYLKNRTDRLIAPPLLLPDTATLLRTPPLELAALRDLGESRATAFANQLLAQEAPVENIHLPAGPTGCSEQYSKLSNIK